MPSFLNALTDDQQPPSSIQTRETVQYSPSGGTWFNSLTAFIPAPVKSLLSLPLWATSHLFNANANANANAIVNPDHVSDQRPDQDGHDHIIQVTLHDHKAVKKRRVECNVTEAVRFARGKKVSDRWRHRAAALPPFKFHNYASPLRIHMEAYARRQAEQEKIPEPVQRSQSPALELEQHIWSQWRPDEVMDDIVIGDIDYLLPTPDTSPLLKPRAVQFDDLVRVQPIPLRRQMDYDLYAKYYEEDPEFVTAIHNELDRRRDLRERLRAYYPLVNNGEVDRIPSEFKEEEDAIPEFDNDPPWLACWPNDALFDRLLDEEEETAQANDKEAEGQDSESKGFPEYPEDDDSSDFKQYPEDDVSSDFKQFPEDDYTPVHVEPLVAPLTSSELANLEQVAQHSAKNDRAIIAELPTIKLTTHDFGTLVPTMFNGPAKGWLNDNVIDEYLDLLVSHIKEKEGYVHVRGKNGTAPPVHALKSQWFTSMKKSPESTARWARPVNLAGQKLFDCNLVLIPICDQSHWRLIAIKPKTRLIEYYDSLRGTGDEYLQAAHDWVRLVLKEHYVEDGWYIANEYQKSEKQVNARDCGVFTILNSLVLLREEEHDRVEVTDGMDDARLRIAVTLLQGKTTTEFD